MKPSDQNVRERFTTEVDRNFSVIAPAGVGKTRAIVDRIIHIATSDADTARRWLPKFVVVTYTRKAADEMHQRARNAIIARGTDLSILGAFNRAFFGTIHSFCQHLLTMHGCHLGLPARVELAENDDRLWGDFVRQMDEIAPNVPAAVRAACLRHAHADDLIRLGRTMRPDLAPATPPGPCPQIDIAPLLRCTHKQPKSLANIQQGQALAQRFVDACRAGDPYVPVPSWKGGGKEFEATWQEVFAPLRKWLREASRWIAADVAGSYRDFRLAKGQLTYDDQIALALALIRHPDAGRAIAAEEYRVILDEAQDTDPVQFDVLLALSGEAEPGRFSMVGDPQQSIYGSRADLAVYRGIHQDLMDRKRAEELVFEVTFRCDQAIVDRVNEFAPAMLDGNDSQAAFVTLRPRPGAGPGQVVRWTPAAAVSEEAGIEERARAEAQELAAWIRAQGLDNFHAGSWSDVAILCPRTKWLATLRLALQREGLLTQVQSDRDVEGDHPACAWFTALLRCAAEPRNGFEIAGLLREVFGASDEALADFSRGDGSRFRIDQSSDGRGPVAVALNLLHAAREQARVLPLRDAMDHLVRATLLRERLTSIADQGAWDSDGVLDGLLVRTAEAEAAGVSLAQWSEDLQATFLRRVESRALETDAIQLITCQKAKGLEWKAVILPMFFRPIGERSPDYPALIRSAAGAPPTVALDGADYAGIKPAVEAKKRQEYQRLLYVAMTRAREVLVVADDAALFDKHAKSFAELLGVIDGPRAAAFRAWPTELFPIVGKTSGKSSKDCPPASLREALRAGKSQSAPAFEFDAARARAGAFMRRVLPSSLAAHPELEPERALDADPDWNEAARAYGTWWHETMELMRWQYAPASWLKVLEERMPSCPAPERARREWALLLKSGFPERLAEPGFIMHAEMPFLAAREDGTCVEGIIDLAVFDPDNSLWLVIDWKTNESGDLRAIYKPQLRAYAEALTRVTGHPATCGIYATATGAWIEC